MDAPPMTDEEYVDPYVSEQDAVAEGKRAVGRVTVIATGMVTFAAAATLFISAETRDHPDPLKLPAPIPKQCPIPGQQNV